MLLSMVYKEELVTEGDFVTDNLFTGVLHKVVSKDGALGIEERNFFSLLSAFPTGSFKFIIRRDC